MFKKHLQLTFATLAMLCLFTLSVNFAQADDNSNPQPQVRTTWGAIKALYRGNSTDQTATTQDQSTVSRGLKGGAEMMAGTVDNQNRWRSLTQSQRNEAICQSAYAHMISLGGGTNVYSAPSGYNCKTWVQGYVVPVASRSVATIPASSSWCTWYPGQYVGIVGYGPAGISINGASRGNIVQASWGRYPHTMIVWSRDASGVWVIDCNYDLRGGLTIHYITFSSFESTSGGCYTVYQIVGG